MAEAHSHEPLPPASELGALLLHLRPVVNLTKERFFKLCQLNRDLRLERTAEGDILVMPPTGARTGARGLRLTVQVGDLGRARWFGDCLRFVDRLRAAKPGDAVSRCRVGAPDAPRYGDIRREGEVPAVVS